ncbi:hypothetical protein, partial [Rahnella variigena]|uniref:hypothetical protein n=1 Tax=Rahnella variigena TaxID=574964 RepID=UPI001C6FEABA
TGRTPQCLSEIIHWIDANPCHAESASEIANTRGETRARCGSAASATRTWTGACNSRMSSIV